MKKIKDEANKHVHTFQRIKGRKNLYMCLDKDCKYYADLAFLMNKVAKCRFCGNEYILEPAQLKRKDPRCSDCRRRVKKVDEVETTLDRLLKDTNV